MTVPCTRPGRPTRHGRRHAAVLAAAASLLLTGAGAPRRPAGVPAGSAAQPSRPAVRRPITAPVAVRADLSEADAVLATLTARRVTGAVPDTLWARLWATAGYRRLAERERGMGRAFSDSAFRAFVLSDTLRAREPALAAAVARWRTLDVRAPAVRAAAYLPPGNALRATLYPVIKPATNSFVFDLARDPAFFVYVDPAVTPAKLENTLAHELHHVGYAAACGPAADARDSAFARTTRRGGADSARAARLATAYTWLGAFGEGLAMLAAAGGPDVHPHAASADSDRVRWDRDVANAPADLARVERFFTAVLDGTLADPAAVRREAFGFFGVQGPWYTVGYAMARIVEVEDGRARLVAVECDPAAWLAAYDAAAARANAPRANAGRATSGGVRLPAPLPRWSPRLLARLHMR